MNQNYKTIFLPAKKEIIENYQGFILDDVLRPDLAENDVYNIEINRTPKSNHPLYKYLNMALILVTVPIIFPIYLILIPFDKEKALIKQRTRLFNNLLCHIFGVAEIYKSKERYKAYKNVEIEDVPAFMEHCHKNNFKIVLYSHEQLNEYEKLKINDLLDKKTILGYLPITKIEDLAQHFEPLKVSLNNSILVLGKPEDAEMAVKIGFDNEMKKYKNNPCGELLLLWGTNNSVNAIRLHSKASLCNLKSYVEHYLFAKNELFTNGTILFFEEQFDSILNNYIKKNLVSIQNKLAKKHKKLLYFPSLATQKIEFSPELYKLLRYKNPHYHQYTDLEISEYTAQQLSKLTNEAFNQMLVDAISLPYFPKPSFVRQSTDYLGHATAFSYYPINYKSEDELDLMFDNYIDQISLSAGVPSYSLGIPEKIEDGEIQQNVPEIESVSDAIETLRKNKNYNLLADTLLLLLQNMHETNPAALKLAMPVFEERISKTCYVQLSSIKIDKNYRIFFPEYGQIELKLFPLAKAVYVFYLKQLEGVRYKELYQFRNDFLKIYRKTTNKGSNESIEKTIDELLDARNANMQIQIARIGAAFRAIMDEDLAKNYLILGPKGEAKKIDLPKTLIIFEN